MAGFKNLIIDAVRWIMFACIVKIIEDDLNERGGEEASEARLYLADEKDRNKRIHVATLNFMNGSIEFTPYLLEKENYSFQCMKVCFENRNIPVKIKTS